MDTVPGATHKMTPFSVVLFRLILSCEINDLREVTYINLSVDLNNLILDTFSLENLAVILHKGSFQKFSHPYAVSVDKDYLYWTDWQEKSIYRWQKRNASAQPEVMRKQLENIRDVHAYDSSRQPGELKMIVDVLLVKT